MRGEMQNKHEFNILVVNGLQVVDSVAKLLGKLSSVNFKAIISLAEGH